MINNPEFKDLGDNSSLFDFIDQYCESGKLEVNSHKTFHRLCSLMRKMGVKTAIVEKEISFRHMKGLYNECQAIKKFHLEYYSCQPIIKTLRITFVKKRTQKKQLLKLKNSDFIASVVLINYRNSKLDDNEGWRSYIFCAFIATPSLPPPNDIPLLNYYVHICKDFKCSINLDKKDFYFYIKGSFFCQQNQITSSCAHSALCMIINNSNFLTQKNNIIFPETINKILKLNQHSLGKFKLAKRLLTKQEIESILLHAIKEKKFHFLYIDFFKDPNIDYREFVYHFLESGFSVLLGISTKKRNEDHIVSVLGHTLSSDMWDPEAKHIYSAPHISKKFMCSSSWIDQFIIHDDNIGMYLGLSIESLKRITIPKYDEIYRAKSAYVIIPKDINLTLEYVEKFSISILPKLLEHILKTGSENRWIERLHKYSVSSFRPFVVRTLFIKKKIYSRGLDKKDFSGNNFSQKNQKQILEDLTDIFCLAEVTFPDLYTTNRTKLIDFYYLLPLRDDSQDFEKSEKRVKVRFPGILLDINVKSEDKISIEKQRIMNVTSHYPLQSFYDQKKILEW